MTTVTVRSHSQTVCCGNETLTNLRAPPTWPHADFVCRKEAFPKFSSPSRPFVHFKGRQEIEGSTTHVHSECLCGLRVCVLSV